MGKSKRLASPQEENFQIYEKDNKILIKKKPVFMYSLRSVQNVNKTVAVNRIVC